MTGDGVKISRKNRPEECCSGRQGNGLYAPETGTNREQDQLQCKKPKLDVSFTVKPEEDGSLSVRTSSHKDLADKKAEESTAEYVGDCSTCGDAGFQAELFRCSKCCVRLQHTYCSNSYNPRKRWFIGLCNWCEAEVPCSRQASGILKPQGQGTKRDGERVGHTSIGKVDKMNAVECLLGAALRLPSAGFSVEDLLQVGSRASCSGRRKSFSFDTVEKAKRSGPNCDNAVKSTKRLVKVETVGAEIPKSASSSLVKSERVLNPQSPRMDVIAVLRSSPASSGIDETPTILAVRDIKVERMETASIEERKENVRRTSNERIGKRQNSTSCEIAAKSRRCSASTVTTKAKPSTTVKLPGGIKDERSEGSLDNAVGIKQVYGFLDSAGKPGDVQKSNNSYHSRKDNAGSVKSGGDSGESRRRCRTVESMENTKGSLASLQSTDCDAVRYEESRSSPATDSTGGSDCSNVTEQRSGGDYSSPKKTSQTLTRQLLRPNYVFGKSSTEERGHRKCFDHKDSKLRRTSSKIAGFHNYKSLSDILC